MKNNYENIQIAGKRTIRDWMELEKRLVVGGDRQVWQEAAQDYFYERLRTRFLKPLDLLHLEFNDTKEGEGFSIVAILCCLIEFLESTAQGRNYRHRKRGEPKLRIRREYGESKRLFVNFLLHRDPFRKAFNKDRDLAEDFYTSIRCAVLHEACTKNPWRIWADGPSDKIIDSKKKILYRNNFRKALLEYVDWYKQELLTNPIFQVRFIRKFNHLCK